MKPIKLVFEDNPNYDFVIKSQDNGDYIMFDKYGNEIGKVDMPKAGVYSFVNEINQEGR